MLERFIVVHQYNVRSSPGPLSQLFNGRGPEDEVPVMECLDLAVELASFRGLCGSTNLLSFKCINIAAIEIW